MQLIAKARNINSDMPKKDIIFALNRSKPAINKEKYISYLNKDTNNVIHNQINKIRMQLFRKRMYDIGRLIKRNRSE